MISERLIIEFDKALKTLFTYPKPSEARPDQDVEEPERSPSEKRKASRSMRVNHSNEVCAQALYRGQIFTSSNPVIIDSLSQAVEEKKLHLAWTEQRIEELGGRKSFLNPIWYCSAFVHGMVSGRFGDDWKLGYLAETEKQIEAHLTNHLAKLPDEDRKTACLLEKMRANELKHEQMIIRLGARDLPWPLKQAVLCTSRFMVKSVYYI